LSLWQENDALHARMQPDFFRRPTRDEAGERANVALRQALGAAHDAILVAAEASGGAVRGLCHVRVYDTPRAGELVAERRGHVENLIVAATHRRRGGGRALVEAAAAWARKKGARQLLLTVWSGNEGAERFYAALGYARVSQVLGTRL
jgi:ribosomal protein S18 acetylase RimI-like enzyme